VAAIVAVIAALGAAGSAWAADSTAQGIVDKALERNAFGFDTAVARLTLKLRGRDGNERSRLVEIRSMQAGGLGRTLVRFLSPADVAGTGFLVLETKDGDDEQYLYLPALGKVKRVVGSQRQQKFMGTDLTYADLEWTSLRQAKLTRLDDQSIGPMRAYVIEAVPQGDSEYGKTVTWIDEGSFVPVKVEFYGKDLALAKTLLVKKLEKREGHYVAMETWVKDVRAGSETLMQVTELASKAKLSEADFTERALVGE
jgi:hypothetical protein